ncbi:DUF805 domain-containing protein [Neorhizobium sp. P12A]|nr:DUF805 domain-containing protein [Neorhizobium sp. P12A]
MHSYIAAMSKYATFSGRATRSEFWMFMLVSTLLNMGSWGLDTVLWAGRPRFMIIGTLVGLIHCLPSLAVFVRRLHDTDRTGAWYFFMIVPIVGTITILVFLCSRSTPGSNRFGPQPGSNTPMPSSGFARS